MHTYHFLDAAGEALKPVGGSPTGSKLDSLGTWRDLSFVGSRGGLPIPKEHEVLICWSGSWAERDAKETRGPDGPRDGLDPDLRWENDPRTWGARGWDALGESLNKAENRAIVIRTHARHVVSDLPGIARVLREFPNVQVLVDPASMLTEQMLLSGAAEDHLRRIYEGLVSGVMARSVLGVIVAAVGMRPDRRRTPGPVALLDRGSASVMSEVVRRLARETLRGPMGESVARVLVGEDPEGQQRWLEE